MPFIWMIIFILIVLQEKNFRMMLLTKDQAANFQKMTGEEAM